MSHGDISSTFSPMIFNSTLTLFNTNWKSYVSTIIKQYLKFDDNDIKVKLPTLQLTRWRLLHYLSIISAI